MPNLVDRIEPEMDHWVEKRETTIECSCAGLDPSSNTRKNRPNHSHVRMHLSSPCSEAWLAEIVELNLPFSNAISLNGSKQWLFLTATLTETILDAGRPGGH